MKILPLYFSNPILPKSNKNNNFINTSLQADSFTLSFNGYVDSAVDSSKIHCPLCGQKMLSQNDYDNLIHKASKVKNTADFVNILEEYREYIPENMRNIYELSKENSDKPFDEFFKMQNKAAYDFRKSTMKSVIKFMKEYEGNLSPNQRELLYMAADSVTPGDNFFTFKQKILEFVPDLEFENEEKINFLRSVLTPVKESSEYFSAFNITDKENLPIRELSKEFFMRIFSKSLMKKSPITKIKDWDPELNEVLVCSKCDSKSTAGSFLAPYSYLDPNLKKNLTRYLEDISAVVGSKDMKPNTFYIKKLCDFISSISKNLISFSTFELEKLQHLNISLARHEGFAPIEQTKVDVHCAGCSSIMMPHKIRKEFEKDLQNANTLLEYAGVMNKYSKYIGDYSKDIAMNFIDLVLDDPAMDHETFILLLQDRVNAESAAEADRTLAALKNSRKYYKINATEKELATLDKIIDRVSDYFNQGKFSDFMVKNMFDTVFEGMDLEKDCPPSVYDFMTRIRRVGYMNLLAKPNEKDAVNDKNQIHTIVYNIFKPDFATADHLIAKCKDGENTKNNLIGLCKACNTIVKNRKGVAQWMFSDPRVKFNIKRQLNDVDMMVKQGIVEDYDDWSENIVNTILQITNGKINVKNLLLKDE